MYSFIGGALGLALVAGMAVLEGRLAFKNDWRKGILPIILVTALMAGIWGYSVFVQKGYEKTTYKYAMHHGNYAEITVVRDRSGKIKAFSDLKLYDSVGTLRDEDSFRAGGDLTWMYSPIENYFIKKLKLEGSSSTYSDLSSGYIHVGDIYYKPKAMWLLLFIFDAPLIVIYIFARLCIRYKKKKDEMRRLNIELGL